MTLNHVDGSTAGPEWFPHGSVRHQLPNDILTLIIHGMEPVDQICLALTLKQFYHVTITTTSHRCLNDLIADKLPPKVRLPANIPNQLTLRLLLARLVEWVPRKYVLYEKNKDKYIREGMKGVVCDQCRRIAREGRELKIEELKGKLEKGLKLEWYENIWLEREGQVLSEECSEG